MKKLLSIAAMAAMSVSMFTACSDDDNQTPNPTPVTVTEGLYVVNSGNMSSNIPGSLTYIGNDGNVVQNAFKTANGTELGDTPNDALLYGSKLYVVASGSNVVWVVDRNSLKEIKMISTTELMGDDKGKNPRRLAAAGNNVYVSTFDGYVAAVDTTDYTMADCYQAGSYPEGMAVGNGKLYVANSDYGQGVNPSISEIDLNTGETTDRKDNLIMNPTSIVATGDALYVLDYGRYDANWNQTDAGVRKIQNGEVSIVADATLMAVDTQRGLIYTVNAPYSYPAIPVTYGVYDITTGQTTTFIEGKDIDSPAAIAVDPVTGDVFISSYRMNPDTGYADYFTYGYVNRYRADGTFVATYDTGVGPTAFAFNYYTTNE